VSAVFGLSEKELPKLSRKSKLAEAIRYTLSRRASLERFLSDGRVELDSDTVERAIRPQTITRKNSLFAGSDGGNREPSGDGQNEQRRSARLADPNARTHRQRMAQPRGRCSHAMELSALSGIS
jgi:hypothetical protein